MDTGLNARLEDVLHRHGERWQISQECGAWIAVERPKPTALTVHAGLTLAELAAKLDKEDGR